MSLLHTNPLTFSLSVTHLYITTVSRKYISDECFCMFKTPQLKHETFIVGCAMSKRSIPKEMTKEK